MTQALNDVDRLTERFVCPRCHHARSDVAGWFGNSGFSDVTVLDSPLGAVEVRGIRGSQGA